MCKKAKQPDLFNDEIVQAMSQRDHFKCIKDENMYKHWRNKCVQLTKDSKTEYCQAAIQEGKGDSRKLWQYLIMMKL